MSQSRARAARKPSLRDQLARKRAKVITLYFPIDDQGEQAKERVIEAQKSLQYGKLLRTTKGPSAPDLGPLETALAEAEAERDKHCLSLRIRGLSEDERDALASEYMTEEIADGVDEDRRREIVKANAAKSKEWTYHAMAAAVLDSDLTADEWREELTSDRWSAGDVWEIRDAIMAAYGAQPADSIPKG